MRGVEAIKDRDFNIKFTFTGKHEMDQLISVYNQMIDQLRLERTKQEEQHFFLEKLIHTSPTGIVILDYDENIQQLNPKAIELLGIEGEVVNGQPITAINSPIIAEIAKLAIGHSKTITINGFNTYKIQKSHFIDRGFARYFVMIEELTSEILAAEKKAYGKVIRMMAHEVNNTIGPVNSILNSALRTENIWKENHSSLRNAMEIAVNRNQNLNHFMRNFADVVRLPEPKKKRFQVNALVSRVSMLLQHRATEKGIAFHYNLAGQDFYIEADEAQMEQVLINIIKNAIEAIPGHGKILFASSNSDREIVVTDTGVGIDETIQDDMFSPFFSTKKDGQGVGLTLVKEILLNHGFSFSLKTTEPGETNFVIRF
jgi:nitrogen fixation/metabolism regulation signal transduction histidine kinase